MRLRWLRTASVECFCGGKYILIDPFFVKEDKVQNQILSEAVRRADIILITHPHLDHFSDIAEILKLSDAPVYVSGRGWKIAQKRVQDISGIHMLSAGRELKLSEDTGIRVWPSRHIRFDFKLYLTTLKRAFQPENFIKGLRLAELNLIFSANKNDIYGFEITESGKRIFVLGSANLCSDINYPQGMDCLVFPFQGRSNITEYSETFINRLHPKRVLLTHFDDSFPPISSRVDTSEFCKKYPIAEEAVFDKVIELS